MAGLTARFRNAMALIRASWWPTGLMALALAGCAAPPAFVAGAWPVLPLEVQFGNLARARGSAVLLPGGRLLTAGHVVDEASLREELCRRGRWPGEEASYLSGVVARLGGTALPATRLGIGRSTFSAHGCDLAYRGGADLALLRLASPPPGPGALVCPAEAEPGQAVVVATVTRQLATRIAAIAQEAEPANGRYAVLAERLESGDSGGGVFDRASFCLFGIVSQRDPQDPDRSWIVRTSVIRAFLATLPE